MPDSSAPADIPDIRIDDLANPRFPPEFAEQVKQLEPLVATMPLEANVLIDRAIAETGLDDFGADGWREGLDVVLRGLRDDYELSPTGVLASFGGLLAFLKNRLLLEDLIRRHPEIESVEMVGHIVIFIT